MNLRRMRRLYKKVAWRDVTVFGLGVATALTVVAFVVIVRSPSRPLEPQTLTITSPWIPETVKRWHEPIEAMAQRYDIDPNLIAIIMTVESGGYSRANSGQAQGLMQITPETAKDIAKGYVKPALTTYDIYDPQTSIEFGTAYLAKLRDIYGTRAQAPSWDTTVELLAAAYNGGFGAANAVEKGEGLNDPQTVVYSRDAFNMWRERHATKSPTFERWKERGGSELIAKAQTEK